MSTTFDLVSKQYGQLLVLRFVGNNKHGESVWLCRCTCGTVKPIVASHLRTGATKSCGCLRRNILLKRNKGRGNPAFQHGHTSRVRKGGISREYHSWQMMKERTGNPNATGYENYGGRGIKVCKRWINSFKNFLADMGLRPTNTTLDRKKVNGESLLPVELPLGNSFRTNSESSKAVWL